MGNKILNIKNMKALSIMMVAMVALVSAQVPDPNIDLEKTTPPTESLDHLMNLLITKGFAKEKEDNIDLKCGCDCTCCQARKSQYWIDEKGANTAAREYVSKYLHLSGQALENHYGCALPREMASVRCLEDRPNRNRADV